MDRRHFLKLAGAAALMPGSVLTEKARASLRVAAPVRIRGVVRSGRRGLARVAVTDGISVVETRPDGSFELISSSRQPFVHVSLPAGYEIPKNPTGTARLYQPITANVRGEMTTSFDLQPLERSDDKHAFVVLADPQTQDTYETGLLHEQTVPDVIATLGKYSDRPTFGVACGDIMFDDLSLFPEYERAVSRMGAPFFQVLGNHDEDHTATDEGSAATFSKLFGPTYYSFDRGAIHYVVLDDVFWHGAGYIGYLNDDQLTWLRQDLARVEQGRTVVVMLHIPVYCTQHIRAGQAQPELGSVMVNRGALYELLKPYKAHIISGHNHEHEHVFEGGVHEHVLGATCGAWWSGPICNDGSPSGYAVFEANGDDLRWRYKGTGLPDDYQVRAYDRGSDPRAVDEIVANVWDWDPEWRVVWYEGSDRKGVMARRTGTDPLSEKLHRGPQLPPRRTWVDPLRTDHLFYAPVAQDAGSIRVEAIDRWGRTYTATPTPLPPTASSRG